MRKNNQTGRSMVEMLGVLAIIGVLSVGAIAGYQKAMFKYKLNKFNNQLSQIVANVYTACAQEKNFGIFVSNEKAKKLNIIPDDMYKDKNSYTITHALGGELNIYPTATSHFSHMHPQYGYPVYKQEDFGKSYFNISVNRISKEACIALLTANWGSNSGLFGMGAEYMGGAPTFSPSKDLSSGPNIDSYENYGKYDDTEYSLPFTISRAEKVCSKSDEYGSNGMTLGWIFVK